MARNPGTSVGYPRVDTGDHAAPIGRVDAVTGNATVQHADGTSVALEPGAPLYPRDLIATKADAKLALVFADRTTFALGDSGQMRLDALDYDPAGQDGALTLSVLKGSFAFATGAIAALHADAMTVRTPVGTLGVRGTTVSGTVDPGGDSFFSALPDATGAASVVAFTNAAGTQLVTDNSTIAVTGFFAPPGAPVQLADLGAASDLVNIASTLSATVNPGAGTTSASPGFAPSPSSPDPGTTGAPTIIVTGSAPPPAPPAPPEIGSTAPPPHLDIVAAPPPQPPSHPHPLDTEPGAFGPPTPPPTGSSPPSGPRHDGPTPSGPPHGHHFIGTLGQDVFQGTRGPDLFDFVTVPNSLQSGDSVDGGGGRDTLIAAFNAPFTIDHTLAITNVPLVEITLPGGANTFDASGVRNVSSMTLHGPGNIALTDGTGIAALVITDPGHHDTLGGFAQVTYQNHGDPSGLHRTAVDLVDVPAGGTRIDFQNHPGDTLTLHGVGDVSATVSGAAQITGAHGPRTMLSGVDYHVTVTGAPPSALNVALTGDFNNSIVFDTTGPVTASVAGAQLVVGSGFGDTLTAVGTAGNGVTIEGGAGNDLITARVSGIVIEGGGGNNTLVGAGGLGDVLSYQHAPSGVVVDLVAGVAHNGYGGVDRIAAFSSVIGSLHDDVITTTDSTYSVVGGGGADTVHLGGTHSNILYLQGISAVDFVPGDHPFQTWIQASDWGTTARFDLTGVGNLFELDLNGSSQNTTELHFSNTSAPGTVGLVDPPGFTPMVVLNGARFDVTFDGTVLNGGSVQLFAHNIHSFPSQEAGLNLDASRETGSLTVVVSNGVGNTLIGTSSDTLVYNDSTGPHPVVTVDRFGGSALSGHVQFGSSPTDIAMNPVDSFTNFGTLQWGGLYPNTDLIIGPGAGAGISVVDLQTGAISGAGGTAHVFYFSGVTNLSSTSLYIIGPNHGNGGIGDVITAGSGDDTITAGTSADTFIGGSGADHFLYHYAGESTNQLPNQIYGPDLIENFHDSGHTSVLDVASVSTVTQHFGGDKGTLTRFPGFAAIFAGDHPGDVDYATITSPGVTGPDASHTYVHVALGAGYSSNDLIVNLQGAHVLTAANFHLHA
jgi:hypothetical protein